jgi:hypothetical protein
MKIQDISGTLSLKIILRKPSAVEGVTLERPILVLERQPQDVSCKLDARKPHTQESSASSM